MPITDDMSKYAPPVRLFGRPAGAAGQAVVRSQIERVVGAPLPASARRHCAWWANERIGTHSHARAWLDAGYETRDLDVNGATVEFVR